MKTVLSAIALASLAPAVLGQAACPPPITTECLVKNSQYTVIGTVKSTDVGVPPSKATDFNAVLDISCVYSSFSSPPSTLLKPNNGTEVSGWGFPHPRCTDAAGGGAKAAVGDTRIYFLYVAGVNGAQITDYRVFDPCTGGVPNTPENQAVIGRLLDSNPNNKLLYGNCPLPATRTQTTNTTTTTPAPTNNRNAGSNSGAASLGASLLGSLAAVFYLFQ